MNLRSSDKKLLVESQCRSKAYGDRAFSICGPRLWNKLPLSIRMCECVNSFKRNLKTYLFKMAFDHYS